MTNLTEQAHLARLLVQRAAAELAIVDDSSLVLSTANEQGRTTEVSHCESALIDLVRAVNIVGDILNAIDANAR